MNLSGKDSGEVDLICAGCSEVPLTTKKPRDWQAWYSNIERKIKYKCAPCWQASGGKGK